MIFCIDNTQLEHVFKSWKDLKYHWTNSEEEMIKAMTLPQKNDTRNFYQM